MLTFWAAMHAMGPQRASEITPDLSPDQEAKLCVRPVQRAASLSAEDKPFCVGTYLICTGG